MNIDFPFQMNNHGHTASTDDDTHIKEMIEQLLFTNPGERVNRPNFGSGLAQLLFGPNSPELATALQFTMQATLQQWLDDLIQVQSLEVSSVESTLNISIKYIVRGSNQPQTALLTRTV
jgi:uncharacterized protein